MDYIFGHSDNCETRDNEVTAFLDLHMYDAAEGLKKPSC